MQIVPLFYFVIILSIPFVCLTSVVHAFKRKHNSKHSIVRRFCLLSLHFTIFFSTVQNTHTHFISLHAMCIVSLCTFRAFAMLSSLLLFWLIRFPFSRNVFPTSFRFPLYWCGYLVCVVYGITTISLLCYSSYMLVHLLIYCVLVFLFVFLAIHTFVGNQRAKIGHVYHLHSAFVFSCAFHSN